MSNSKQRSINGRQHVTPNQRPRQIVFDTEQQTAIGRSRKCHQKLITQRLWLAVLMTQTLITVAGFVAVMYFVEIRIRDTVMSMNNFTQRNDVRIRSVEAILDDLRKNTTNKATLFKNLPLLPSESEKYKMVTVEEEYPEDFGNGDDLITAEDDDSEQADQTDTITSLTPRPNATRTVSYDKSSKILSNLKQTPSTIADDDESTEIDLEPTQREAGAAAAKRRLTKREVRSSNPPQYNSITRTLLASESPPSQSADGDGDNHPVAAHFGAYCSRKCANNKTAYAHDNYKDWWAEDWYHKMKMYAHIKLENETGNITIRSDGLYFIYAQMLYGGKNDISGYSIRKNNRTILECITSACNNQDRTKWNTCFTGGIFHCKSQDVITASPREWHLQVYLEPSKSFMGMFKLANL